MNALIEPAVAIALLACVVGALCAAFILHVAILHNHPPSPLATAVSRVARTVARQVAGDTSEIPVAEADTIEQPSVKGELVADTEGRWFTIHEADLRHALAATFEEHLHPDNALRQLTKHALIHHQRPAKRRKGGTR